MRTPYAQSLDYLKKRLGIDSGDAFTQDWVHELPEEYRTVDWLNKYVDALLEPQNDAALEKILVDLVLDVCNDLEGSVLLDELTWGKIDKHLRQRLGLHDETIRYWAMLGEPLENCFAITARVRGLLQGV